MKRLRALLCFFLISHCFASEEISTTGQAIDILPSRETIIFRATDYLRTCVFGRQPRSWMYIVIHNNNEERAHEITELAADLLEEGLLDNEPDFTEAGTRGQAAYNAGNPYASTYFTQEIAYRAALLMLQRATPNTNIDDQLFATTLHRVLDMYTPPPPPAPELFLLPQDLLREIAPSILVMLQTRELFTQLSVLTL